jgi:HEAT repeat protein
MRMTMRATTLLAIFLSCFGFALGQAPPVGKEPHPEEADIRSAVARLWDPDGIPAQTEILRLGSSAGPCVLSLLEDLLSHPSEPHFIRGRELEAEEYRRDAESNASLAEKYDITRRLIYDCVFLLGQMRYSKAVPAILRLMEEDPLVTGEPKARPYIVALEEIGESAVVPLIEVLQHADEIAARFPMGDGRLLRVRASLALMDIGDPRAIPELEDLVKPGGAFEGDARICESIESMRKTKQR